MVRFFAKFDNPLLMFCVSCRDTAFLPHQPEINKGFSHWVTRGRFLGWRQNSTIGYNAKFLTPTSKERPRLTQYIHIVGSLCKQPTTLETHTKRNFWYAVTVKSYLCVCVSRLGAVC